MPRIKSGDETSRILTFNGLVSKLDHLLLQFHLVVVIVVIVGSSATNTCTLWRLGERSLSMTHNLVIYVQENRLL